MVKVTPEMIETGMREHLDKYPETSIEEARRLVTAAFFNIWPHFSEKAHA